MNNYKKNQKINVLYTILGAIFIGALGSGLWDILFKPGIGEIFNFFISLSDSTDNQIFINAALEPDSTNSAILLFLIIAIDFSIPQLSNFLTAILVTIINWKKKLPANEINAFFEKNTIRVQLFCRLLSFLILISVLISLSSDKESQLVWSYFHKNLDICTPLIKNENRLEIISKFRQMKTREDFEKIKNILEKIANDHNINLQWY